MRNIIDSRIEKLLSQVTSQTLEEGKNWYKDANKYCQELSIEYNKTFRQVVGILAALSPMKEWGVNKRQTRQFLEFQTCGTFGRQINKSLEMYDCIVAELDAQKADKFIMMTLNGMKTKSFYHNIVYPSTSRMITVDTHMLKLSDWTYMDDKKYQVIEQAIQEKADSIDMLPLELQAILWLQIKNSKSLN